MAGNTKPMGPLEKPVAVESELEGPIQVPTEDESIHANQDVHHNKALTRKLLFKLDTRCALLRPCISSGLTCFA